MTGPDGLGTFELGTREARQITLPPCNGQFRYGVCNCNPGWSGELCGIECNNRGTIANSSTLGNVSLKHTNCECDPGWGGAPVFFEGGPARPNGRRWRGSVQCFFDRQTGCFGRGDIYSRPPYCRNCSAGEPDSCKCDDFRTGHMCDELDKAKAAGALRKKQEEHLYYWIIWFVVTGAMFCGCSCFGMCCRREVDYNPLKRFLVAQFVGMDMWSDLGFVAISLQSELFKYQFQGDYHVLLILAIAAVAVAFIAWMVTFLFEMCDPTFQMGRAFPPLPREGSIRHIVATGILFVVEDLVQFALQLLYFSTGQFHPFLPLRCAALSSRFTLRRCEVRLGSFAF